MDVKFQKIININGNSNHIEQIDFQSTHRGRWGFGVEKNKYYSVSEAAALYVKSKMLFTKQLRIIGLLCIALVMIVFLKYKDFTTVKFIEGLTQFDVTDLPFDAERLTSVSIAADLYCKDKYMQVISYATENFTELNETEKLIYVNSLLKEYKDYRALQVLQEMAGDTTNQFPDYIEYKLAYMYVIGGSVNGLEILRSIIKDDHHIYQKKALEFFDFSAVQLLIMEENKMKTSSL